MEYSNTNPNESEKHRLRLILLGIILVSTIVRLTLAHLLELGNDEVYYWTYALYPDLSHFDHPPMVGFVISLFTLNGLLKDDFFLRLGPIVFSAFNTWLLFSIVKKIADERSGIYAALLFNSSIYFSIICGFAIVPDAPLVVFWLLSLNLLLDVLPMLTINRNARFKIVLFGVCAGLAVLSKYHGVFIWIGAFLYILFYNRKWLTDYSFYLAGAVTVLIASPILIWNVQHDFITFAFHGARVAPSFGFRPDYFVKELGGQMVYQNPLAVVVFIPVVVALIRRRSFVDPQFQRILVLNSLPLWLVFTGFSLFRSTLPHWTGPAFISLIILSAIYWSGKENEAARNLIPAKFRWPAYFLIFLLALGVYLVNYSPFQFGKRNPSQLGENDFAQDVYGWKLIGEKFAQIADREERNGSMAPNADLISFRWFPGSHLDFYAAYPAGRKLFLIGDLSDIHKYAWINEYRGGLTKGDDYYYIAPSNYYRDPQDEFGIYFKGIEAIDTIRVERNGVVMRYAFLYRMKRYLGNFKKEVNTGS